MHKLILQLLSPLCLAQVAFARDYYFVYTQNKDKTEGYSFSTELYERVCYCISKTSTYMIGGDRGGD
ncbi:hypothetical protein BGZ74_002416, partial [Mortierella antarctica]